MVSIIKSDGSAETFDPNKLITSLTRAGATAEAARDIADAISKETKEGTTTHEIYRRAFAHLRDHKREAAARYSLKRAVLEFGPSGFPFEAYLAEIFRSEGYTASVDQHIQGKCVEHEVDVVLTRGDERIYVEAKFHNTIGFKTDLQVALYVQARTLDIIAGDEQRSAPHSEPGEDTHGKEPHAPIRGMIATNTKFTSLATSYAECNKLELLGWDYPVGRDLHDRIEASGLYPITALTSLSRNEKTALLAQRVVLCRDLGRHEEALAQAGVQPRQMQDVLTEAGGLCNSGRKVQ